MEKIESKMFAFEATGNPEIDEILRAVAEAGSDQHHVGEWSEEPEWGGLSPLERIQAAANAAASKRG